MRDSSTASTRFGWGYFLVGVLFVIGSFIAFFNPAANLEGFVIAYAILAIIQGGWLLFNSRGSGWRIAGGIADILIGIFMLANTYLAMLAIPYVFAIWFIIDSIFRLFSLGQAREVGGWGYFWFSLIINVLGVIVGIMLLFQPAIALLTFSFLIGFYLMMVGVLFIVAAFSGRDTGIAEAYVEDDTRDRY